MAASVIFLLLGATALSGLQNRRWVTLTLFFVCWIAIALLFRDHVSDRLDISLWARRSCATLAMAPRISRWSWSAAFSSERSSYSLDWAKLRVRFVFC